MAAATGNVELLIKCLETCHLFVKCSFNISMSSGEFTFNMNSDKWKIMGIKSREIAEERFDVRKVNDKLISILGLKG